MNANTNQQINQPPARDIDPHILAEQVAAISEALNKLLKSGLNERAILVLLRDYTNVGMADCKAVLQGLRALKSKYTTLGAQPVAQKK